MSVGICHNGNLINAKLLRRELEQDGARFFHSSSDTEVLIHLIRRSKEQGFKAQQDSLRQIKGGIYHLVMTKDTMYGVSIPLVCVHLLSVK